MPLESLTKFGKLLADNQIEYRSTAPYYPQGNGKAEASIKSLLRELLAKRTYETLDDLQTAADKGFSRITYNYRLHSALARNTPRATPDNGSPTAWQGGSPGLSRWLLNALRRGVGAFLPWASFTL